MDGKLESKFGMVHQFWKEISFDVQFKVSMASVQVVNESQNPGVHSIKWDGKDNNGINVSAGVYIYRIQAGDFVRDEAQRTYG